MISTRWTQLAAVVLATGLVSAGARAGFPPTGPLFKISELSTGSYADPNAQYLVLRMEAGSGTPNIAGYMVVFYQIDFHEIAPRISLVNDANRRTRGMPYLIANSAAQTLYHVTPDFVYSGNAWPTQGYVCVYEPGTMLTPDSVNDPNAVKDDCLAYGNVSDTNTHISDSSPANAPFNPTGGVPLGFTARRSGGNVSGSSALDFVLINPNEAWPANNRGVVGSPNRTSCGSGKTDGSKQCDAGMNNGIVVPGCSSSCRIVPDYDLTGSYCGDGVVDPDAGEACDDGGTSNIDGCSSTCQWEDLLHIPTPTCGNYILEASEECDGGPTGTADCSSSCVSLNPASCGNGVVEPGEQCDTHDAGECDTTTCFWTPAHLGTKLCGNAMTESGEECDDGNTTDGDGCSAQCLVELAYVCPNQNVEPGEQCEPAESNCSSTCTWITPVVDPPISTTSTTGSSTAGPGVNTTAGGGSVSTTGSTSTGGSGASTGSSATGGTGTGTSGGGSSTGGTDSTSSTSSTSTTGSTTAIKTTSCAQTGAPGLLWTLGSAALLWYRRKRMACTLSS